jgi:galactoside O-acetyltransferase
MTSFYNEEELKALGLKAYGENVLISRKCSIYGAENISLGSNVRIDDFCVLSGKITVGSYVHIAVATLLYGGTAGITLEDYTCASSRCAIYAISDDYSGEHMTNAAVPDRYTGVTAAPVVMEKHSIIGTGCTVFPGVTVAEGCSVGAMSLVNRSTQPWGIYMGIPARRVKERSKKLLELCAQLEKEDLAKRNGDLL